MPHVTSADPRSKPPTGGDGHSWDTMTNRQLTDIAVTALEELDTRVAFAEEELDRLRRICSRFV